MAASKSPSDRPIGIEVSKGIYYLEGSPISIQKQHANITIYSKDSDVVISAGIHVPPSLFTYDVKTGLSSADLKIMGVQKSMIGNFTSGSLGTCSQDRMELFYNN